MEAVKLLDTDSNELKEDIQGLLLVHLLRQNVILRIIECREKIRIREFEAFCSETYQTFRCYEVSPYYLHTYLAHAPEIIKNNNGSKKTDMKTEKYEGKSENNGRKIQEIGKAFGKSHKEKKGEKTKKKNTKAMR